MVLAVKAITGRWNPAFFSFAIAANPSIAAFARPSKSSRNSLLERIEDAAGPLGRSQHDDLFLE